MVRKKYRRKECKSSLRSVANILYRNIVGRLNWSTWISRPESYFFCMWIQHKIFESNNSIYSSCKQNYLKSIRFPKLDLKTVKLRLFPYATFNNLPNGGGQAGQVVFLTDPNNKCFAIYWNSSKVKCIYNLQ